MSQQLRDQHYTINGETLDEWRNSLEALSIYLEVINGFLPKVLALSDAQSSLKSCSIQHLIQNSRTNHQQVRKLLKRVYRLKQQARIDPHSKARR